MPIFSRRALAAVVLAGLALSTTATVAHAEGEWACVGVIDIDVGVCVYNPLPERLPLPDSLTVAGVQQWAGAWAAYAQGTATSYATALSTWAAWFTQNYQWYVPYLVQQCSGAVNQSYRPGVTTGWIPDPLAVVPDVVVVPSSSDPVLFHTWQCVDAGPIDVA